MNGRRAWRTRSDTPFFACLVTIAGAYVLLIVAMIAANAGYTSQESLVRAFESREIRYAAKLSLVSSTITAIVSVWFAVPIGYLLSRYRFRGRTLVDSILDIPILLPPMVIGLSLLILFQSPVGRLIERHIEFTFRVPSVILAQFTVACAFAVRTMVVTFDQIDTRPEDVARTLGCTRRQAFWHVALPQAMRGAVSAGMLAWARALGEFGPILVFSGATRMRTEVLPSTVFLELSIGNVDMAAAVSILLVTIAVILLVVARLLGVRRQR